MRVGTFDTSRSHSQRRTIVGSSCFPSPTKQTQKVRINLGRKWREYHGCNNWDGLLDPLDDNLRSELLRYGNFVRAAYDSFDFDPTSTSYGSCLFPKHSLLPLSGMHDSGYRVTRHLHASSSIELPHWVPSWASSNTSCIGYVAVCDDEEEIVRLGRRDIVIAFRGTATCLEWMENLRATMAQVPGSNAYDVMVERGFLSLFSSSGLSYASLQDEIRDEIGRLTTLYSKDNNKHPLSITITGHSLGAALALLAANDVASTFRKENPHVAVISFGGPRVGNERFRREVEEKGVKVLRIVNTRDIVTKVPGFFVDDKWPCWLSMAGMAYSDVGQELSVSCPSSSMAACHDLNVYLRLVQQLTATCPLKRRSEGGRHKSPWNSDIPMQTTSAT